MKNHRFHEGEIRIEFELWQQRQRLQRRCLMIAAVLAGFLVALIYRYGSEP